MNTLTLKLIKGFCFLLILSVTVISCSLNNAFLKPDYHFYDKIDKLKRVNPSFAVNTMLDSNKSPVFVNDNKDTLKLDYKVIPRWFLSTSGNRLHSWEMIPKESYNGITLVMFHGNSGNVMDNHYAAIPLVKNGFKVLIFDYSGYGLSQGKPTRANVKKDGLAAVDYVIKNKDSLTKKIFIYGLSLGGHLTPVIGVERESEIDGLIIEGAFSSHRDISHHFSGIAGRVFVAEKYNGKKSLKKFHKPVLIIHSTEDATIPYEMGKTLYEYANEPKKLLTIDQCHICGLFFYSDL